MKCSCGPIPARPDRPHVLLKQERAACAGCATPLEVRTVLRAGEVHRLRHCPKCGTSSERIAADAAAYVETFLAQGAPERREGHVFKHTTAACPTCLTLLDARVVIRDGKVFLSKDCAECGPSQALVSEDAAWYVNAYTFARAGSQPLEHANEVARGCPEDCGLCPDHEQHTCVPIIEVTDHCNLSCPACLVDNGQAHHLDPVDFGRILGRLVAAEGQLENVALSGGEPSSHPRILELVDLATRPEVGRVVMLTNGLRIARDRAFAEALKAKDVYVGLQLDGFSEASSVALRGRDLRAEKEAALRVLEELDIPTQLVVTVARGVNEDQLGALADLMLSKDHIISLNVQPIAYTGRGGGAVPCDPMDRVTVPGVLRALEAQTAGRLRFSDFCPLPCPSPHCVALAYLLKLNDGTYLPFPRFADLKVHGGLLRNSASLPALPEIEKALTDVTWALFAKQDEVPGAQGILAALRRAVDVMFPERPVPFKEALRRGERQAKSIFVHHYMDPYDFDLERLRKCCNHYPQVDGRLMPACGFNLFHRGAAKGAETPRAAWGRAPWTEAV